MQKKLLKQYKRGTISGKKNPSSPDMSAKKKSPREGLSVLQNLNKGRRKKHRLTSHTSNKKRKKATKKRDYIQVDTLPTPNSRETFQVSKERSNYYSSTGDVKETPSRQLPSNSYTGKSLTPENIYSVVSRMSRDLANRESGEE